MRIYLFILFALFFGQINVAQAHIAGVTDTHILIGESAVNIVYTVPLEFLQSVSVQSNLSLDEIAARAFTVSNNGENCQATFSEQTLLANIESQQYVIDYDCGEALQMLSLDYSYIVRQFNDHENITHVSLAGRLQNLVLGKQLVIFQMDVTETLSNWGITLQGFDIVGGTEGSTEKLSFAESLKQSTFYFSTGLKHILFGFDHLMFLLALLLLPLKLKELLILVTSFTVAHSITLALSVFDVITLPALLVEFFIAFSIVYVALENIWVVQRQKRANFDEVHSPWKKRAIITFAFGLLHGFGFSNFLKEIGFGNEIFAPLLMFNLGVEGGQLFAILCCSPVLYFFYKYSKKQTWLVTACSLLIALVGIVWLLERI